MSKLTKGSVVPCLFLFTLIVPNYYYVGSLRLTVYLIFTIVVFPILIYMWVVNSKVKILTSDYLILFSTLWGGIALTKAHGFSEAIEPTGVLILQTFGSYLLGRCFVRSKQDFIRLFNSFFLVLLIFLPFGILETLNGSGYYLRLASILGPIHDIAIMEPRKGLERAQVAFEHPILYGVFVASGLAALASIKVGFTRIFSVFLVFVLSVTSVSTGAILAVVVQVGIISWGYIFRKSTARWRNLILLVVFGYIFIDLLSNRTPFNVFVDYLTFNSGSAYNRILIWEYGTAEVARHPLFGIGLASWTRPYWMSDSMDNFWLLNAVRYGLPQFVMLAAGILFVLIKAGKASFADDYIHKLRNGLVISIIGVIVSICSVHLWNATYSWFMFMVGSATWLCESASGTNDSKRQSSISYGN
ncbi:MAG: O-antigen ligase family protein [Alphaproteobacteria bacterium]